MIGIYKITNKINGKAYIGQSVDIKRRWKEHKRDIGSNKNPMYLDFKKYGLSNFIFEVIEECTIKELDKKEIFYIDYFDTYKNGYNLTQGGQNRTSFTTTLSTLFADDFPKFSNKQWLVYSYLLSISKYDALNRKEPFYILKSSFLAKDACQLLKISQPTWRAALKELEKEDYIINYPKYILIKNHNIRTLLDINLIRFLLPFGAAIPNGGNIISVYSVLYRYWRYSFDSNEICEITINQIRKLFNAKTDKTTLASYKLMLILFEHYNLMKISKIGRQFQGNPYTGYIINEVKLNLPDNIEFDDNAPDNIEKLLKSLEIEEE